MSEVGTNDAAATATAAAGEEPVKTAKQLEKEAKKAAKLAKLQEKLDKQAAAQAEPPKEVSLCDVHWTKHSTIGMTGVVCVCET